MRGYLERIYIIPIRTAFMNKDVRRTMSRPAPNNTYKSFRQSLMIIIFLTLSFHSTFSQSLKEQSFLLTDRLLDECNVNAMCDCCASDLVFVSDNKFVLVDYCTDHGTY